MNTSPINDAKHEIKNLVDDAAFYAHDDPQKAMDLLDQAKANMTVMFRMIWDLTYTSGKR